jgi:hypothetical protein
MRKKTAHPANPAGLHRHVIWSRVYALATRWTSAAANLKKRCAAGISAIAFSWSVFRSEYPLTSFILAHVLVGEAASTPDQAGGRLSPEHALRARARD